MSNFKYIKVEEEYLYGKLSDEPINVVLSVEIAFQLKRVADELQLLTHKSI